jgi:glutamate--cysteine ligase catalytic subunit
MLEGTPRQPFRGFTTDLLRVERSMRLRRKRILATLAPDEICPTVTSFPQFGVGDFTHPVHAPGGPAAQSAYVSDAVINPHPRFAALTANIRARRGSKVDIRVPLYRDACTPEWRAYDQQQQQGIAMYNS